MSLKTARNVLASTAVACCLGFSLIPTAGQAQEVRAEPVARGLEHPWAVAFLPEGRFLVTERPGRMRVVDADGKLGAPLAGVPAVVAGGQGGLLDVVLDSGFARNRIFYFCFSEPGAGGNSTALARATAVGRLCARWRTCRVIFSQKPKVASSLHFGCRIVEARDGTLFLTLGERFSRKDDAQKLDNHHGKVVRLTKDGGGCAGQPLRRPGRRAARDLELRPPQRTGRDAGAGRRVCGCTSTARRAATRSTCRSRAATTAGP